jgi:nucleotide-binding universal stress UspA family protein
MSQARAPYEIVVGVDYSELSEHALLAAFDTARARPGCRLHVIAVAEGYGPRLPDDLAGEPKHEFIEEAHQTLDGYVSERIDAAHVPLESVRTSVDFGEPVERILALAQKVAADLIVVGSHGRKGIDRMLLGSVTEHVLRRAHCSVLVTRGPRAGSR